MLDCLKHPLHWLLMIISLALCPSLQAAESPSQTTNEEAQIQQLSAEEQAALRQLDAKIEHEQARIQRHKVEAAAARQYSSRGNNGGGTGLGLVASNLTSSIIGISGLIKAISYITGAAFFLSSLMKFKVHRDNPLSIPLSTPITELFVALILIFLPYFSTAAGVTAFGEAAQTSDPAEVHSQ